MRYQNFFLTSLLMFVFFCADAQTGTLTGKVMDESNSQPLAGAVIIIKENSKRVITESDGHYNIQLPVGKYSMEVNFVGYDNKKISEIEITKGAVLTLNITLTLAASKLSNVVVLATSAKKESLNSLLLTRRNAAVVSDGISADMIRKSPDRSTSDVLKRVSGTTVQENKFVVVRGMNDRYNEAMLNGILLPSSEPDRKTFAFDIFPSEVVDNITIYKSASPDFPGSFAGGLVQVNTKDVPDKKFLSVKAGGGFNSLAAGRDFYTYKGGKADWLGIDNKVRAMPADISNTTSQSFNDILYSDPARKTSLDRSFSNTWAPYARSGKVANNLIQIAGGFNAALSNDENKNYPRLGGIFAVTYNSSFSYNDDELFSYGDGDAVQYHYYDSLYVQNILESALGNLTFKINPNNKLYLNSIISVNATDQVVIRGGSAESVSRPFVYANSFFFVSNRITNSQFGGEHYFPKNKLKIKWTSYYTDLKRDEPDYRYLVYSKDYAEDPFHAIVAYGPISTTESGLRFFGSVKDYSKGVNADASLPLKIVQQVQTLKFGGGYYHDDRKRTIRYFNTVANPTQITNTAIFQTPGEIFQTSNFDAVEGFYYNEPIIPSNHYDGFVRNASGYIMLDNKFSRKIRFVWGVRLEAYRNTLNGFNESANPVNVDIKKNDWLPSGNLVYSILPKANLRLSYGRTVARPLFRELAPQIFYDFLTNITYSGTPSLVPSYISNYEVRWEHFFNNSQYYSFSVFYKLFKNPIEQNVVNPSAESLFVNFVNTPEGKTQGIEGEVRKNFDFISKGFENLVLYANASIIKSTVSIQNISNIKSGSRPLFGQSPYIINTSLQYTEPKTNTGVSVLFNQAGSRLFLIAGNYDNIIWEKPRPILDFKVSKSFAKNGLVEFSWGDILHQNAIFFNDLNENKKYDGATTDRIVINKRFGYTMSLSVSYRF